MDFDDDHSAEIGDLPVSASGGGGSAYDSQLPNSSRIGPVKMDTSAMGSGAPRSRQGAGAAGGRYRECLKNHAVGIGGHAVDGCGEFMAAGEEGTLDALKCAACNCHRNFHRKEVEGGAAGALSLMGIPEAGGGVGFHHHQFSSSPYYRTPTGYLPSHHHHHHHLAAHLRPDPPPLALPSTSGGGGGGSRDDQEDVSPGAVLLGGGGASGGGRSTTGGSKKRFRTKFTQEQKDRMLEFAERLGWRMQKHDEAAVFQFCADTGVKRQVLKVWMHNNKHTLGKGAVSPAVQHQFQLQHDQHQHQNQHHQQQQQAGVVLMEREQVVDMGERVVPPGA